MGDVPQRQSSTEHFQASARDPSPNSLINPNTSQLPQSNMEFEPYTQHHFGMGAQSGAMDMRNLAGALPDVSMRSFQQPFQQQFSSPNSFSQNLIYPLQQGQFAGQTAGNYNQPHIPQLPPQYPQARQTQQHHGSYSSFMGTPAHHTQAQSFQNPALQVQPGMMQQVQNQPPFQTQQFLHPHATPQYAPNYSRTMGGYQTPQMRSVPGMSAMSVYQQQAQPSVSRTSSNSSLQASSALRGPPRKPKQSGYALWVGNLPPGTHIIDLKDHFSRDATNDIESVFLISKSNCAFVNYKTESSCAAAMTRFHDSRFQGVRLVCRLRRGSASASPSSQTGPSVTGPAIAIGIEGDKKGELPALADESAVDDAEVADEPEEKVKEKFFVVKSLTVEDLERSVQSGVWATQAHNEVALNKAYQTAGHVYLIFSANKSGEYFGYARMDSAIDDEAAAEAAKADLLTATPRPSVGTQVMQADVPLTIPTPPTDTAPLGRIIDDSSRGTIFWEAENDDDTVGEVSGSRGESGNVSAGEGYESASAEQPAQPQVQSFGKAFKIRWMSTDKLPFYRTRGLRNPWNANREVKIARDGTEIEPTVGRKLVDMFHRPHAPQEPGLRQGPMQGGMPMPMQGQSAFLGQQQGFGGMMGNINPYGRSF